MKFRKNPSSFWGKFRPASKRAVEARNYEICWWSKENEDCIKLKHFLGSGAQSDAYLGRDGYVYYLSKTEDSLSKGLLANFVALQL